MLCNFRTQDETYVCQICGRRLAKKGVAPRMICGASDTDRDVEDFPCSFRGKPIEMAFFRCGEGGKLRYKCIMHGTCTIYRIKAGQQEAACVSCEERQFLDGWVMSKADD